MSRHRSIFYEELTSLVFSVAVFLLSLTRFKLNLIFLYTVIKHKNTIIAVSRDEISWSNTDRSITQVRKWTLDIIFRKMLSVLLMKCLFTSFRCCTYSRNTALAAWLWNSDREDNIREGRVVLQLITQMG